MEKKPSHSLLLTAAGFLNPRVGEVASKIISNLVTPKAVVVTTAASERENNKYAKLAKEQLGAMNIKTVDFIDIGTEGSGKIPNYDIIYVCGGNTFALLQAAQRSDFKNAVLSVLNKGGVYIGVSAGSLIVGPSVKIASEVAPDRNKVNLSDYNSLNLVSVIIFPHYEVQYEDELRSFEEREGVRIIRLNNMQALLIQGDEIELIQ